MTGEQTTITEDLTAYLRERTRADVTSDQDVFASGLISSMAAMELVLHLEQTYAVVIAGADLQRDNFRTADAMAALVCRLRKAPADA